MSNMSIALERRDFLQSIDCFVCNTQEAGILFSEDFSGFTPEQLQPILSQKVINARIPSMIVTMGGQGAVYASMDGQQGYCPVRKVAVHDTTGAGDAFCTGAAIGLTYGKGLQNRYVAGCVGDCDIGKCVSPFSAERIGIGYRCAGLMRSQGMRWKNVIS